MSRHRMTGMAGALVAGLSGCAAAPGFGDGVHHQVIVDGYRFAVIQKGEAAEVIRLGWLSRAERDGVPARMILAAEAATGCRVIEPLRGWGRSPSLVGDTGEARFRLNCTFVPRPRPGAR